MKTKNNIGIPGRPRQIAKKDCSIKFRVTPLQKRIIFQTAKNTNMDVSEFCRRSVLNQRIYKPFTDEELSIYSDLSIYHTNFKRIKNLFSTNGISKEMIVEIENTLTLIKTHLKKFKSV